LKVETSSSTAVIGRDTNLASLRAKLPAVAHRAYFNAGTNGPISIAAHEALVEAARAELERGRIGPGLYETIFADLRSLRALIGTIIGADADEIALTRSTTEGINIALFGMTWSRGDEVITTNLEHGGLYSPLGLLAHRHGVGIRTVNIGNGEGDPTDLLLDAITPRTRAIAISHLYWSTGSILPLRTLALEARRRGVVTIVDGAQSGGQIPLDMHELEIDAYTISGQKWFGGPGGSGALYVRRGGLSQFQPTYLRYGTFDPNGFVVPPAGANRFEMGEVYNPAMRAQAAGLRWLVDEVGLDWAYDRIATLGRRCWDALRPIPGVTVVTPGGPADQMAGIVCFTIDGWACKAVSDALWERGFIVRHVEQPPCPVTVRISNAWWNTEDEVDAVVATIADLARHPAS
jgi:L-cysteine/cystine lyase